MPNFSGFIDNKIERSLQFRRAKAFFDTHPDKKKCSRKKDANLDNSYIKLEDGTILALSSRELNGTLLGEGLYARGKFGLDENDDFYAIKIETTNTPLQEKETSYLADLSLLARPKTAIQREDSSYKYYTTLTYLGKNLETSLWAIESDYKISLAREMAWAVHQLHSGALSQSGVTYAHLDLKPGNMVIDHNNHVYLIDFGTAHPLDGQPYEPCFTTSLYAPVTYAEQQNTKEVYEAIVRPRLEDLGPKGVDVFALKRSLFLPSPGKDSSNYGLCVFSRQEFSALDSRLKSIIDTSDLELATQSIKETDTPLSLAITCLALECDLDLDELNALSLEDQAVLCEKASKHSVPLSEDDEDEMTLLSMKQEITESLAAFRSTFRPS